MPIYTDYIQTAAAIMYGILLNSGRSQFAFYCTTENGDIMIYPCGGAMNDENAIIIKDSAYKDGWRKELNNSFKKIRLENGAANHSDGLVEIDDLIIAHD
jgi:hypothetical protein